MEKNDASVGVYISFSRAKGRERKYNIKGKKEGEEKNLYFFDKTATGF